MWNAALIALALAYPVEVFEEWALTPDSPVTESVTARAVYLRRDGPAVLLPPAVQGARRPVVHAFGHGAALVVTAGARGWQCTLPPGERDAVRLVAHVDRPIEAPRLFRFRWPRVRATHVPTRRVAVAPRAWIESVPQGWTCPAEAPDDVPCVTRESAPAPLSLRASPLPSPRGSFLAVFVAAPLALAWVARNPSRRGERVLAALAGATAALAVCLALVGAHHASWGGSLAALLPLGVLVGSYAPRRRLSRIVATAGLALLPLCAVFGMSAAVVLALALGFAVATLGGAFLSTRG